MATHVDRGAELAEALRLERLEHLRIDVQLLRRLQQRQLAALTASAQTRADAALCLACHVGCHRLTAHAALGERARLLRIGEVHAQAARITLGSKPVALCARN